MSSGHGGRFFGLGHQAGAGRAVCRPCAIPRPMAAGGRRMATAIETEEAILFNLWRSNLVADDFSAGISRGGSRIGPGEERRLSTVFAGSVGGRGPGCRGHLRSDCLWEPRWSVTRASRFWLNLGRAACRPRSAGPSPSEREDFFPCRIFPAAPAINVFASFFFMADASAK